MRGEVLVLNESIDLSVFGNKKSAPECGKWQYDSGVLMRGLIRKEAINLPLLLSEIHHAPDYIKEANANFEGLRSFEKGGMLAGGNTIVGLMTKSSKERNINNSVAFWVLLKDGRKLLLSTNSDIFDELRRIGGVKFKSKEQCTVEIEERLRAYREAHLKG